MSGSLVPPSGPGRPFAQVMRQAEEKERQLTRGPKQRATKPDRRPPFPPGWRSLRPVECERNPSLRPQPGQGVIVAFPEEWRRGKILERGREGYLIVLDSSGGKLTLSLTQFLVEAP